MLHKIRICVVRRSCDVMMLLLPGRQLLLLLASATAVDGDADADFAFALDDNFILNRVIMKE